MKITDFSTGKKTIVGRALFKGKVNKWCDLYTIFTNLNFFTY